MNTVIVVYHCSLLFLAFFILIVLVVRTPYSLYRAPIVRPFGYCFQLQSILLSCMQNNVLLFCVQNNRSSMYKQYTLYPLVHQFSQLCSRLVVVSLNDTSSLNCIPDIHSSLLCLTQTSVLSILHLFDVSIRNLCCSSAPMNTSKPIGEACTPDGGLKEAHAIEWFNDPDDDLPITDSKSAVNQRSFLIFTLIRQELTASAVQYPSQFECIWCCHTRPELCR